MQLYNLPDNWIHMWLDADEAVGGDRGFNGFHKHMEKFVIPFIATQDRPLTEEEERFNNEWASIRTVVENVFAHIKKWKACALPLRTKDETGVVKMHQMLWMCASYMHNEYSPDLRSVCTEDDVL